MSTDSRWRQIAAPIIARVIAEHGTEDMRGLRRALREAYPFGSKRLWPYRVWCREIHRQLGPPPAAIPRRSQGNAPLVSPGQLSLLPEP